MERNTRINGSDSKFYIHNIKFWTVAKRKFANNDGGLQKLFNAEKFSSSSHSLVTKVSILRKPKHRK